MSLSHSLLEGLHAILDYYNSTMIISTFYFILLTPKYAKNILFVFPKTTTYSTLKHVQINTKFVNTVWQAYCIYHRYKDPWK